MDTKLTLLFESLMKPLIHGTFLEKMPLILLSYIITLCIHAAINTFSISYYFFVIVDFFEVYSMIQHHDYISLFGLEMVPIKSIGAPSTVTPAPSGPATLPPAASSSPGTPVTASSTAAK